MAAGDFSPSTLVAIRLKAEQMWQDSALALSLKPNAEAAIALLANQTARFRIDTSKDNTWLVLFLNACAVAAQDCVSNCDLTEPELESGSIPVAPDLCKKSGFSINEEKFRTNYYSAEEAAAEGLNASRRVLDEWWAQQVLLKLKQFAGINVAPQPFTFNEADMTTEVPEAAYTPTIVPNFLQQAILNNMGTPYFLDNGSLWLPWITAQFNQQNAEGKGNAAMINAIKMYFDQINFGKVGLEEDTFMISPGALAMQTINRVPDTIRVVGGEVNHTTYQVPSLVLPGVRYDVYNTVKCITNATTGRAEYLRVWRLETNGMIVQNPTGCPVTVGGETYNPTGVLSYSKIAQTT